MMWIESVAQKPDRSGRYRVTFENGTFMRLYRQTVEDFGLYSGMELGYDQLDALRESAGLTSARMRAVRIVSAAGVSKQDLEERLIRKGEQPEQAKAAVEWMQELNLIDDRQTAQQTVARCISKGYGRARAKQALYEKRIPKAYWEEVLADYPDQVDKIFSFLQTRLGDQWDERDLKRAIDALLRRGHSYHDIQKALRQLEMDASDLLEE